MLLQVPSKPGIAHTVAASWAVHFLLQYEPCPPTKQAPLAQSPSLLQVSSSALPLPASAPPPLLDELLLDELLLLLEDPLDDDDAPDDDDDDEPPLELEELEPEAPEPPELLLSGSLEHPWAKRRETGNTSMAKAERRVFMTSGKHRTCLAIVTSRGARTPRVPTTYIPPVSQLEASTGSALHQRMGARQDGCGRGAKAT